MHRIRTFLTAGLASLALASTPAPAEDRALAGGLYDAGGFDDYDYAPYGYDPLGPDRYGLDPGDPYGFTEDDGTYSGYLGYGVGYDGLVDDDWYYDYYEDGAAGGDRHWYGDTYMDSDTLPDEDSYETGLYDGYGFD